MAEKIEINVKEVKKIAKRIGEKYDTLVTKINNLYNDNLYKIGDSWKDKENYNFVNSFSDYLEDLSLLVDSIADYKAFLEVLAEDYEKSRTEAMTVASTSEKGVR